MSVNNLEEMISHLETYLECWKQFNSYIAMARSKKFEPEDEAQFLEVKSIITQEMEMILSSVAAASPTKEEVVSLVSAAPSLRYISELNDNTVRSLENSWHKIYISWQSLLGQLKVAQRQSVKKSFWGSLFGKK